MKNKALKKEQFTKGGFVDNSRNLYFMPSDDNIKFANSDRLRKIKNRNRKNKRK